MRSKLYSGWVGPRKPKLLLLGEAWGSQDNMVRQPFVGTSGHELWRMIGEAFEFLQDDTWKEAHASQKFGEAWVGPRKHFLEAHSIAFATVFNFMPPAGNIDQICENKKTNPKAKTAWQMSRGKYLQEPFQDEVRRCQEELAEANPNLTMALGAPASWATLGASNIGTIRGNVTPNSYGAKILPSYSPKTVMMQWGLRPVVVADLMKAKREMEFPEIRRLHRKVLVNPTLLEVQAWSAQTLREAPILSVDIETRGGQITCIGFARSTTEAMVVPFWIAQPDGSQNHWVSKTEEIAAWEVVSQLLASSIPKVFQNGMYDLQYLTRMGLVTNNVAHDTMLLHHSLYPEMQKGLGFLGSVYTNEESWKLMNRQKADTVKKDE